MGCGGTDIRHIPEYFHSGQWDEVRYDIDESVDPDIRGSIQDLSAIASATVDALMSSHNLEHVWSFEVPRVLQEFHRVLKPTGFAYIACPDVVTVAEAIVAGVLEEPLYVSPMGPISPIDILYGHQEAIRDGQTYMAHKHAFSATSLARSILSAGFAGVTVRRDGLFGLSAIATKEAMSPDTFRELCDRLLKDGGSKGVNAHHGTHLRHVAAAEG